MAEKQQLLSDSEITGLVMALQLKEPISTEFLKLSLQNVQLFDRKQSDYGPRNISSFGFMGCIIRMSDKFERVKNLIGIKRKRAVNESVIDSLDDISNYAIIAKMCHKGIWPK